MARSLGISPPNISYNLSRQTEAMILTKEDRRYRIIDRVFATWLRELCFVGDGLLRRAEQRHGALRLTPCGCGVRKTRVAFDRYTSDCAKDSLDVVLSVPWEVREE